MMLDRKWKWRVTGYYAKDVKSPKKPLELALQTVHADDMSKDLEVSVFRSREDIGEIHVERLQP